GRNRLFDSGKGPLADHDLAWLCLVTEPRREIYDAAICGVFAPMLEPDLAESCVARSDSNSETEKMTLARPRLRQLVNLPAHIQRQANGALGVIGTGNRIVKDDHDPVPQDPFQRAFISDDKFAHALVILLQDRRDLFRFRCFSKRGESPQIAEHHRYLAAMTRQKRVWRVGGRDHLRHLRGEKSPQTVNPLNFRDLLRYALLQRSVPT